MVLLLSVSMDIDGVNMVKVKLGSSNWTEFNCFYDKLGSSNLIEFDCFYTGGGV